MFELKRKAARVSFWISMLYVGAGTIMLFIRISPDNSIMQILAPLIMILTVPVIFIGFGIIYGGVQDGVPLVLLTQVIVFFATWYIIYSLVLKNYKKKNLVEEYKNLKEIFQNLIEDNWDVNNVLTWTFTFIDPNESTLQKIFNKLKIYNYQLNLLVQNNEGAWILEVSRKEILTPEKLARRNLAFQDLVAKYHVGLYQGWDVKK